MKKTYLTILLLTISVFYALACEMTFRLSDTQETMFEINLDEIIELDLGKTYILTMEYYEDHRNCLVGADSTLFFLNGSRWRPGRDTATLILNESIEWKSPSQRLQVAEIHFTANIEGESTVEIIRECNKGGYSGTLQFYAQ